MKSVRRLACVGIAGLGLLGGAVYWIAHPSAVELSLPTALEAFDSTYLTKANAVDLESLAPAFRSQRYRSFCGPASLATVLRASGRRDVDQTRIFPAFSIKLDTFFTGLTLTELRALAEANGLRSQTVYGDSVSLDAFRELLAENVATQGDYVLVNYDRRLLEQAGSGHISPVAAYDQANDRFLILDQAAYKYPFTWVPTALLYRATRTRDGDAYRGILLIDLDDTGD